VEAHGQDQDEDGSCGRNEKPEKGPAVSAGNCRGDQKRSGDSPDLVHGLVQPKNPTRPENVPGASQQGLFGGIAQTPSQPFKKKKRDSESKLVDEGHERQRHEIDQITEIEKNRPRTLALGQQSGGVANGVTQELTPPRHEADRHGARAQDQQERTKEASSALVGRVGKEADGSEKENKTKKKSSLFLRTIADSTIHA
jgi:hypothetical protein